MLDELFAIQHEVLATTPLEAKRYLHDRINWDAHAICLLGGRGVGKTTMLCQQLIAHYLQDNKGLYISADNIFVLSYGLFKLAQEFFKYGGEALFIDEIHKYPNWSLELKNIIDTYRKKKIIFSASSSLDLNKSKYDLSRRVLYYQLQGLSFREYLHLENKKIIPPLTLDEIFKNHQSISHDFKNLPVLKYFNEYLLHGYYPFYLEGKKDYLLRISNIIEKVIFEDIAIVFHLKQSTLTVLKKILWLVATSKSFIPNIDKISRQMGLSREVIYNSFEYLQQAGLLENLCSPSKGAKLTRKPGKIFFENTSLLYGVHAGLKNEVDIGNVRETFFVNQLKCVAKLNLHNSADFIINDKIVIEVCGQSKDFNQIKKIKNAYLALDRIETGFGNKIPLYLFGLLY